MYVCSGGRIQQVLAEIIRFAFPAKHCLMYTVHSVVCLDAFTILARQMQGYHGFSIIA